jgi:hypothetical protein
MFDILALVLLIAYLTHVLLKPHKVQGGRLQSRSLPPLPAHSHWACPARIPQEGRMTANGVFQLVLFFGLVLLLTKPVGAYMARVFQGERTPLSRVLRPLPSAGPSAVEPTAPFRPGNAA